MAEFKMPSLGADMNEATLVKWLVKPGDNISRGQIVAEVDTAKGIIDVECFDAGTVEQLLIAEGTTLPVGSPMAHILSSATGPTSARPSPASSVATQIPQTIAQAKPEIPNRTAAASPESRQRMRITPLAKRVADELKVDLSQVIPTGADGAITVEDVQQAAIKTVPALETAVQTAALPMPLTPAGRMRTAIAAAMARSNREIPHYYLMTSIDMTKAFAKLDELNRGRPLADRLLPVVVTLKALALALRDVPQLNGHWLEGNHVQSNSINIGFAISIRAGGLVAPAIHDTDKKSLPELMKALSELVLRARTGRLKSSEMSEATITLTSLGELGVDTLFGVIYPPQVAIVGLGRPALRPWIDNGMVVPRPIMSVTLAGDHRATDGICGARLLDAFNRHIQEPDRL